MYINPNLPIYPSPFPFPLGTSLSSVSEEHWSGRFFKGVPSVPVYVSSFPALLLIGGNERGLESRYDSCVHACLHTHTHTHIHTIKEPQKDKWRIQWRNIMRLWKANTDDDEIKWERLKHSFPSLLRLKNTKQMSVLGYTWAGTRSLRNQMAIGALISH